MIGLLSSLPLATLALFVGLLIGGVGIGGVILVPSLVYIGGMHLQVAIASCMVAFLFCGSAGLVAFARRGSLQWARAGWLSAGAAPGAYLGASTVPVFPSLALEAVIGALVALSGINTLVARRDRAPRAKGQAAPTLAGVGLLVGFGSALTGTGGPLLLLPALLWLHTPVITAVGLSQAIQIPIAALASFANVGLGSIDPSVATILALGLTAGVILGARLAHRISALVLRRAIALLLVLVGGAIMLRLCLKLFASV